MKTLIYFFIFLLLAVTAGILMQQNPASLFITIGHFSLQSSLWLALLALIVAIFLIYQIIQLLRGIYRIPANIQHFTKQHRTRKLQELTEKGLRALIESRWQKSETYLRKAAKKAHSPFFYYIGAAQAAFEQKKITEANHYLEEAHEVAQPTEQLVVEIIQIRWQLAAGEYQTALTKLYALQKTYPQHTFVLNSLKEAYLKQKNWRALYELLPQLKEAEIDENTKQQLEQQVFCALLAEAGQSKSSEVLEKNWQELPKKWHKNPALVEVYVDHLIEQNQYEKAEYVLKKALKLEKNTSLLIQYAKVSSEDPVKQLSRAEIWLKADPQNPDLLFCAGSLCARHRLWGKAKTYLEASLQYNANNAEVYLLLGQVLEELQERQAALNCYKMGLEKLPHERLSTK